jgi:RNA 3'-terminal phosphate cyclase (ATP)
MIVIDGSYGEGGGQILRTALSLATTLGVPLRIENIRAGRPNPGLQAQHLTAVRAAAAVCEAEVAGDELGSTTLTFIPRQAPRSGVYTFDVAEARHGGSAGATTLVLQTVLLPLAFTSGESQVTIRGGTHVSWSPPYHYITSVYLPALARLGIQASVELLRWGWFPAGGGEIRARIAGAGTDPRFLTKTGGLRLPFCKGIDLSERGALLRVHVLAAAANLPAHIPQRMADRARKLLQDLGVPVKTEPLRVSAACPGAGVFLTAEYERSTAGFSALGAKGKPSEQVAEEACQALLGFHHSGAALDEHLADQLIPPMALAADPSAFTTERISQHTRTVIWVVEQFGVASFRIEEMNGQVGKIVVEPLV